jgi:23S rRNA pseudouridine1911/1915/1917 synthase
MIASTPLSAEIPVELDGKRLDQALAILFQDFSRSRLQQWIRDGQVQVDARVIRPKDKVYAGQHVTVQVTLAAEGDWQAQDIPLDIVYEDAHLLVINKPAGLVVHPAAGNYSGTMLNALLHHVPQLENLPRAGIIHRLDKETSGLLVVAKDLSTHKELVAQLQAREFEREYLAIVVGVMTSGGTVEAPIGRHPVQRKRMAVVERGKPAVTHYRVVERFRAHSLIRVSLETGRTHQIRVHMAYVHFPIVGDPVYGGRLKLPPACSSQLAEALRGFRRQALHAARLGIVHPQTGEHLHWEAPLPADMQALLAVLRTDAAETGHD